MTEESGPPTALAAGVAVLERAISYALGSLASATPALLNRPTPCAHWDLRDLLLHLNDSMTALQEAADQGHVALVPRPEPDAVIPETRRRAVQLLGAWTNAPTAPAVRVADTPLSAPVIAGAGAIELTVHGWDIAQSCGTPHPIPEPLADELLDLALLLIRPPDRPGRFAAPRHFPDRAPPSTRLLAFLGRARTQ
jgi:uncharacterized protein (TIGR03086 family)